VRKDSIVTGMQRVKSMLSTVAQSGSVSAQEKVAGIDAAIPLITGELALLTTTEEQFGGTITTVKKSTYGFGFVAGAIVGLLIALQLTIVDKRVRSLRQLTKYVDQTDVLGRITSNTASLQHVAAALVARAQQSSQSIISLIPATASEDTTAVSQQLNDITRGLGVTIVSQQPIASLSAESLIGADKASVVVATTKKTKADEITDTWLVLQSAQRTVLGAILVDSQH
jgi:gas vesicle protein